MVSELAARGSHPATVLGPRSQHGSLQPNRRRAGQPGALLRRGSRSRGAQLPRACARRGRNGCSRSCWTWRILPPDSAGPTGSARRCSERRGRGRADRAGSGAPPRHRAQRPPRAHGGLLRRAGTANRRGVRPEAGPKGPHASRHQGGRLPAYSREGFEKAFGERFEIEAAAEIPGSARVLYRMRRRGIPGQG